MPSDELTNLPNLIAAESRIKQFIELSQFSIALYNSNPENTKMESVFSWPGILKVFSGWHHQQLKFIVSGYMAAAHYGLVRASTSIEIIVGNQLEICPPPFNQKNDAERFDKHWQNSKDIELLGSSIRIISLTDLIKEFQYSENEIKKMDLESLMQINNSLALPG